VWEALIAGQVDAIVMASDRAEILSTARVEGEIRARRLTIVEGALVNGSMVAGPPTSHPSKLDLIEEAVRWEEAHRPPTDEAGGAGR
jgi:cytoskeletal protein CcmA (bactofilin family)